MTVRELIALLQTTPPSSKVAIVKRPGDDWFYADLRHDEVNAQTEPFAVVIG